MKLKPCKCGKMPNLVSNGYTFRYECRCVFRDYDSDKAAVKAWNTRVQDKEAAWEDYSAGYEDASYVDEEYLDVTVDFEQYWQSKNDE